MSVFGSSLSTHLPSGLRDDDRAFIRGLIVTGGVAAMLLAGTSFWDRAHHSNRTAQTRAAPDETSHSQLQLVHPQRVMAGSPLTVQVRNAGRGERVLLTVLRSGRSMSFDALADSSSPVRFALDSDVTRTAGETQLVAQVGSRIKTSVLNIETGPIAQTIDPIVGPKSMVADGRDSTMAVAFPMDSFGNVAEGTSVSMALRHPSGDVDQRAATVHGLLAWHVFGSQRTSGSASVQVTAAGESQRVQSGRAVEVQEVSGTPAAFTLVGPPRLPKADGATLVRVQTSIIRDVNDNVLSDGTAVIFVWDSVNGRSRGTAKTIGGVAELVFEAPTSPDRVRLNAWVQNVGSQPLDLVFDAAVRTIPLRAERKASMVTVRVGPVHSEESTYLRDGTWADIALIGSEGGRIDRRVQLIASEATIRESVSKLRGVVEIRVNILGVDSAIRLQRGQQSADNLLDGSEMP